MTSIPWTQETWNFIVGCSRCSPGCDHCYAIPMAHRLAAMATAKVRKGEAPGRIDHYTGLTVSDLDLDWSGVVRFVPEALALPKLWRKPRRVFVNSMSDLFHPRVEPSWLGAGMDVMASTPHQYQALTKRFVGASAALKAYNPGDYPNLWVGLSACTQSEFDRAIATAQDLRNRGWHTWLSLEPMLEAIAPTPALNTAVEWVVIGGESGAGARPFDPAWIQPFQDQFAGALFVKQMGANPVGLRLRDRKGETPEEWPAAYPRHYPAAMRGSHHAN